jgi:ABC-type dipeptide/oligopeptide/nickel transport system permease subunit
MNSIFRENRAGLIGLIIVVVFGLIALAAWAGLIGQDWSRISGGRWEPPGAEHLLGTNMLGQDVMERAVFSTKTAFKVGLLYQYCPRRWALHWARLPDGTARVGWMKPFCG